MILIVDNYDSFTHNIAQYVLENNIPIELVKNDQIDFDKLDCKKYSHIIISPGPGNPDNTGLSYDLIDQYYMKFPILGICLGHQLIGHYFGCEIVEHKEIFHGKVSSITNNQNDSMLYNNIPAQFEGTRYHSLVIDRNTISNKLMITAELNDKTIMGIKHRKYPIFGVQYHPESIETKYGKKIIKNFISNV